MPKTLFTLPSFTRSRNIGALKKTSKNVKTKKFTISNNIETISRVNDEFSSNTSISTVDTNKGLSARDLNTIEASSYVEDKIEMTYENDLNIIMIHDKVLSHLRKEIIYKVDELNDERNKIKRELKSLTKLQLIDKKLFKLKSSKLKAITLDIKQIESRSRIDKYTEESKNYIAKYRNIGPVVVIYSFESRKSKDDGDIHKDERRIIINDYLKIAEKYIKLNINLIEEYEFNCYNCGTNLIDHEYDDDGFLTCPECYTEYQSINNRVSNLDIILTDSPMGSDKENFIKALNNFMCRGDKKIPDNIWLLLDNYFNNFGNPVTSEIVKTRELNVFGERQGTDLKLMIASLKVIKQTAYYENAREISVRYWDWHPKEISQYLEDQILTDYDLCHMAYKRIIHRPDIIDAVGKRDSALNSQYTLFRILEKNKYPCRPTHFKIPQTPYIIKIHEHIWAEVVEELIIVDQEWGNYEHLSDLNV